MGRIVIALRRCYLRRGRSAVEVDVEGARLRLDPHQFVDGWLLFGPQFYEAEERRSLLAQVRPGSQFVDVGAHVGLYAILAAKRVGAGGTVLAIEPDARSARDLRYNIALNGLSNVRVAELAAAGSRGTRSLGVTDRLNRAGATLLDGSGVHTKVDAWPLAEITREYRVDRIDVAKFDIEGVEHEVLSRYLADAPRAAWPRTVLVEHYPQFAVVAGDALALLRRSGYVECARWGANHMLKLGSEV